MARASSARTHHYSIPTLRRIQKNSILAKNEPKFGFHFLNNHFTKLIIQNNKIKILARLWPIFGFELSEKRSRAEPS